MNKDIFTIEDARHFTAPVSFGTMVKPAGSACNLNCRYCYYLEKAGLYRGREPLMSDELLDTYVRQYLEANETGEVTFCWHGGEPLLSGIDFFRKALKLQRKYADGRKVFNTLQTNGTKVDENWCCFFRDNEFLVGISIDGPRDIHDGYRKSKSGNSTFDSVLRAISLFKRFGVEFNTLSVVNNLSEGRGAEIYRFFRNEIESRYMQFLPAANKTLPWAVSSTGYGDFLCDVFDEWIRQDVGEYYVQIFDATLAQWCGLTPGVCSINEICSDSLTVEHNGDVYPCDHFVSPEYRLGNIKENSLREIFESKERIDFALSKRNSLPADCLKCKYNFACHGECPEHRVAGKNVLCSGLKAYFSHVSPYMDRMKELLSEGKGPAEIMKEL
ncbi:MAG: anaerobic sulfatase maturase [Bacteroidales bacterium]|nr:anaerobic sulfatase maturase [Bacteroidales bacterium]